MRTTLTLDEDNADRLRELARKTHQPFKRVVNKVIRLGLEGSEVEETEAPYKVKAQAMGLRAGVDPLRISKFESDLEVEAFDDATSRLRKEDR